MAYVNARSARIGFVVLVATILTAGICGMRSQRLTSGIGMLTASQQKAAQRVRVYAGTAGPPATLRYYGGPNL